MNRNRPKRSVWFWTVLCILCILVALLPYLPWLAGGLFPQIQAAQPWLLILVGFAVVLAVIRRRWLLAGFTAAVLFVGIAPVVQFNGVAVDSTVGTLRVFSFNAGKARADSAQLANAISREDPDVLVLVETSEPLIAAIGELGALEVLGYRSAAVPAGGDRDTVVSSRYPLTERHGELGAQRVGWYEMPVVDIALPTERISVVGVHIYPPLDNGRRWEHGLDALDGWMEQQGNNPVILAGDFNATRTHPQFRKLAKNLSSENTSLPLNTWPADRVFPPFIGIDHVLLRGMGASAVRGIEIAGSDHLALSATIHTHK